MLKTVVQTNQKVPRSLLLSSVMNFSDSVPFCSCRCVFDSCLSILCHLSGHDRHIDSVEAIYWEMAVKQGFIVQPLHCQMMGVKCDRNEGNEVGRCPVINNSGPV